MNTHAFNGGVWAAFDAGQTPRVEVQCSGNSGFAWQGMVSGYRIGIP